jgi:hypothetical protein
MQIARFALVLGSLTFAIAVTALGGCSDSDAGPTISNNPTTPRNPDDDGEGAQPAKDAGGGGAKDSGGPRHDGGSAADATSTATCAANGAKALSIDPNHGTPHTLTDLPAADFAETSTDDKQYALNPGGGGGGGGSGQHTHTFTLTGAERAKLGRGETVAKVTSAAGTNAHTHTVTLGCK